MVRVDFFPATATVGKSWQIVSSSEAKSAPVMLGMIISVIMRSKAFPVLLFPPPAR